jgi:SAM-dependent methyltransferase
VWQVAGSPKKVDIFTSWFGPDDQYYLFFAIAGRLSAEGLSRRTILPLRSADLNGRTFPAPREPEALLAALYGPSWSIPDPSFRYQLPADVSDFFRRAKEALTPNRSHWNGFYASSKRPQPPSQFAAMFVREVASGDQVLDLGCGDGRDTAFFCEHELRVIALDYSPSAIKIVKKIKDSRNFRIWPDICNVYDFIDIKKYSERHRGKMAHVYARFFFHALRLEGQHNALSLAHAVLTPGGRLWAEFRTPLDPRAAVGEPLGGNERVDGHYRRFIDPDDFVRDLRARGFEVEYMVSGFGMAKFRSEDPHVARVIAIKR